MEIIIRSRKLAFLGAVFLLSSFFSLAQKKNGVQLDAKTKDAIDQLFFEAQNEKSIGNTEKAKGFYKQLLKLDPNNAVAYFDIARFEMGANNLFEALINAKRACELEPTNELFLNVLTDLNVKLGNYKDANKNFNTLIKLSASIVSYYYQKIEYNLNSKQYAEAHATLDKLEKIEGLNLQSTSIRFQVFASQNKSNKGIEAARKLSNSDPKNVDYLLFLGQVLYQFNYLNDAQAVFENLLKKGETDAKIYLALSDIYFQKGDKVLAFQMLKRSFEGSDIDIDVKMGFILNLINQSNKNADKLDQALELSQILTKVHSDDPKAYSVLGDIYNLKGLPAEARLNYKKAIEIDETSRFPIWEQLLILDLQINDTLQTEKDAAKALELFPNQPLVYYVNAATMSAKGNDKKAAEILKNGSLYLIESDEIYVQYYALMGDIYHKLAIHDKSDAAFEKALKKNPNEPYILNNYAYYLSIRKEKLDQASIMSRKTIELEPNSSSFLDTYAWILFVQNKYAEALIYIEKAYDAGGSSSSTIVEHFGDILFLNGKQEKANDFWKKAKELGSNSENLMKKIATKKYVE